MEDYLVIGFVVLLIIGLTIIEQSGVKPENLLPNSVKGFKTVDLNTHVESIFKGERYSAHSFFEPQENSELKGIVERLGISIYLFWNNKSCLRAKETLLSSYGSDTENEPVGFNKTKAKIYYRPKQNQAETVWCKKRLLFQINAVGKDGNINYKALKESILNGAYSVLETYKFTYAR